MPATQLNTVLDHLRRTALRHDRTGATDADLVECFVDTRDEAAFEALVRRHGPMVLGVCRRVLHNEADAEDAFQATFLVLVRKAGSISPRSMVGNWLYGVAHSTALKAKAMKARRQTKESEAARRPRRDVPLEEWQRLQAVPDEELSRLPDKHRLPIVLCELEGKSVKDAARQLDWPQGTVASRLSRGRTMLGKRLARHDLTLPAGTLAAALVHNTASAALPKTLITSTLQAAALFAAGASISTQAATLAEGMVKAMLVKKLAVVVGLVLLVSITVSGAGIAARAVMGQDMSKLETPVIQQSQNKQQKQPQPEMVALRESLESKKWTVLGVDKAKGTVNLAHNNGPWWQDDIGRRLSFRKLEDDWDHGNIPALLRLSDVKLDPNVSILLDGKAAMIGDLKDAVQASVTWSPQSFVIVKIDARSPLLPPFPEYRIEAIDLANNAVSLRLIGSKEKLEKIPVAKDAKISIYHNYETGQIDMNPKENANVGDLQIGMYPQIALAPDSDGRLVIVSISAVKTKAK